MAWSFISAYISLRFHDRKNQDETGADCGGASCAARCGVGKGCKAQTDCEDGLICEEVWLRCDDGGGGFPWLPVFVCLFLLDHKMYKNKDTP